ncbi:syntaxin-132 [Selaginella moellendorffii]|nr:syntaxin-132 [Selaginella moellendorffii]|eukprot:XP_002986653.2 syntaxin-132 [Selaginella moellendorffii]
MNDLLGDIQIVEDEEPEKEKKSKKKVKKAEKKNAEEAAPADDMGMTEFFQQVADIKTEMANIRKALKKLQDAHEDTKTVTKSDVMKAKKNEMEAQVDVVTKITQDIKHKIESLDKANILNRKKPNCGEGSSTDRTRMSMTVTLKKKLKDVMQEFQNLRQKLQDEYREVVERRIFTVTGQKPDEETVDKLIETGDSETIFQKAVQEQGRGQILDTIAEIQERHDAVRDIEKKLLDLHQIFMDMAVLVEAQGEMLDDIENQVSKAVDHVQTGTAALEKVKKLQRGTRKCMCVGIILLLVIVIIIVVAVIQPWK